MDETFGAYSRNHLTFVRDDSFGWPPDDFAYLPFRTGARLAGAASTVLGPTALLCGFGHLVPGGRLVVLDFSALRFDCHL